MSGLIPIVRPGVQLGLHIALRCTTGNTKTSLVCLENGVERSGIIRSEGAWEVTECPNWVHVSPNHADYKEELTIKVDKLSGTESREGKIVFSLKNKNYTAYTTVRQYKSSEGSEDSEIVLQEASGSKNAIPIFIVGEGFSADNIISGEYMRRMRETMDQFFSIEPYKTYRNNFRVSTAIACSPEEGTGDVYYSKVNCFDTDGTEPNKEKLRNYVRKVSSSVANNMANSLVIVVSNYNSFQGWSNISEEDGLSIACIGIVDDIYPYDQRGLVQHFAGGETFAGLANEQVVHFDFIKACTCPCCLDMSKFISMKARGYFENVTMSSKMTDAPWYEFIFHPKYSSLVDMWEGGYNHLRGVWRSEANSVMNNYIAYFNTISRYAIYKQIMRKTGQQASLEDFIANDKIEKP